MRSLLMKSCFSFSFLSLAYSFLSSIILINLIILIMKVVFIIDHSPLMNLRAVSQVAQAEDGARQSGLTYFQ